MSMSQNPYVDIRLAQLGLPCPAGFEDSEAALLAAPILARQRELNRRLADRYCAADQRVQAFLDSYLADVDVAPQLPKRTFVLDEAGLARAMSLPYDSDEVVSPRLSSYRLANGVLHNPLNDRRTTAGVFHVAEGGLPIPDDKMAVPKAVFARLVELAFQPPDADMVLPYTANQAAPARCYVSLLLRPIVEPAVPGFVLEHRMEVRFFAPGSLVSNLDFVEGVFGNGGDPYLPENDSSLKPQNWTGHTGCVILAPHLTATRKKDLGLPNVADATPRQRRDGMCWETEDELYNGGQAFKIVARDARGVIVTVIADNYFGYCKKEVKSHISYSANLFGNAEEEHAGGARVYPSFDLGQEFLGQPAGDEYSLREVVARDPQRFSMQPGGYALDSELPNVALIPSGALYSLRTRTVSWESGSLPLTAGRVYVEPNGYQVTMSPLVTDPTKWTLVGTDAHVTTCHKPSTVSGGGKSEISKSISDAFVGGNVYVANFDEDMDAVAAIIGRDYSDRFADPARCGVDHRGVLDDARSNGSVIKLLTTSTDYSDEYNAWVDTIPPDILELVYVIKRYYRPEWGEDWRSHFTVGTINGRKGNDLRLDGEKITVNMLRVGFETDGAWRLFGLRHDFFPAQKVQTEDDISASTVISGELVGLDASRSYKLLTNCEALLFQRPDDAILRGYDKQTELDMSQDGVFMSNFQPLTQDDVQAMVDDAPAFGAFSAPMADRLRAFAATGLDSSGQPVKYIVSSANPRLVGGKPSKNPRYLQRRPDIVRANQTAVTTLASHLARRVPMSQPLPVPVDIVTAGRRNNPEDGGIPPLCAFSPLHYMELPELFMEFISSMTGASPSTTGAGSEGAMTKGPFNSMPAVFDLNAALLSYILTGYDGWISSAGYIGPHMRVAHDISLLVPELFSRMTPQERGAKRLIAEGSLEKIADFTHDGVTVPSSRLGYRMTTSFVRKYFGRIFLHPQAVFTAEMLAPELQDPAVFIHTMQVMVTTHERVAKAYFDDGTISGAIPPLRALLEIMANGKTSDGLTVDEPEFRAMFDREAVLASSWYKDRLTAKKAAALGRAEAGLAAIERFASIPGNEAPSERLGIAERIKNAKAEVARFQQPLYWQQIIGTTGGEASKLLTIGAMSNVAEPEPDGPIS